MSTSLVTAGLCLAAVPGLAATAFQIRIVNAVKGPIQVRLAPSDAWATVGHVRVPATRTANGFAAARWSRPGTIAAVAVHGLRIALVNGEHPEMISVVPRQFSTIPHFYGGHIPGQSGIHTDIGAGSGLFREWAPATGSPVRLETASGPMAFPPGFKPAPGDVFLVDALVPEGAPSEVVFENRKDGAVTATWPGGRTSSLGTVSQPVRGTGRFDGTSYTGVGALNTNHPGVITIGTAPVVNTEASEGTAPERRGGFMIQPLRHARDEAWGVAQVMAIAPNTGEEGWEGRFPLYFGALDLRAAAQVRVDAGPWEALPSVVGRVDDSLTAAGLNRLRKDGSVKDGVTAIRLVFTPWDASAGLNRLRKDGGVKDGVTAIRLVFTPWDASAARVLYDKAASLTKPEAEPTGHYSGVKGTVELSVRGASETVTFFVDGTLRSASNNPGFVWHWDTTREKPGRHWVELRAVSKNGDVRTQVKRLLVLR